MRAKVGRLIMCHMAADTEAELHAMADLIGVDRRHHQQTALSHYDICLASKAKAIAAGAVLVTTREMLRALNPPPKPVFIL